MDVTVRTVIVQKYEHWYRDPVAMCYDTLPRNERPRPQQQDILHSIWANAATAFAAHRGYGKTRVLAFAGYCFLPMRANSLLFTLSPTWEQTLKVWLDIKHLWLVSTMPRIFEHARILTHEWSMNPMMPKWRGVGLAASEVQNVEGNHPADGRPAMVLFDESKAIADEFRQSVNGMLKHPESRFVAGGTPGIPHGWFYEAFTLKRRQYKVFQYRGDQSPDPTVREHVEKLGAEVGWDDPFFRQQWLSEFTGADEGVIIPYKIVAPAIGRKFEYRSTWRKTMSVDPAGKGSDHTVVTYRIGPVTIKQRAWQGWDIVKSEREVIALILEWRPERVVIDEGGLGEGVVSHVRDALKGSGIEVLGYRGANPARDKERYENRKAEDVHVLRNLYKEGAEEIERAHAEIRGRLLQTTSSADVITKTYEYLKLLTNGNAKPAEIAAVRPGSSAAIALADEIAARLTRGSGLSIPNEPNLIGQTCSWTADRSKKGRTIVIDPSDSPDYADSDMMAYAADTMGASLRGTKLSALQ